MQFGTTISLKTIVIEYLIKNEVGTNLSQKFSSDYDGIISVFCFAKHETNKTYIFDLKTYIFE